MAGIWKTAYEIIRYTDYSYFNYDDHNEIIWLKNERSRSVMLINRHALTAEKRESLSDNIFNRHEEFSRLAGFSIKDVRSYYETSESFKEKYAHEGVKTVHRGLKSFSNIINHPFYRLEMNQESKKTSRYYANKVMSSHPLETHLTKFTPVTYLLLAINLVVFLVNLFNIYILNSAGIVESLAVSHQAVVNGDYYRMLSSTFLHTGMEHFLFNMAALFVLGKFVESLYGKWRLLIAYLLTGTLASLVSLVFLRDAVSLGASGAVYGLLGIIVVHLLINRKLGYRLLVQIAVILTVIAVFTSFFSNINHYAHFGGLIFGILLGLMYHPARLDKKWYFGALAAFIIAASLSLFFIHSEEESEQNADMEALDAVTSGNYETALDMVNETFAANNETALTYHVLAALYQQAGEQEKAAENFEYSYQLDPQNEVIVKERLLQLRKERNFDEMRNVVSEFNGDAGDDELGLIIKELNEIEE